MPKLSVRVAMAQLNPTVGDFAGNSKKISEMAREAAAKGANIIVFPEMAICGYPVEDEILRGSFIERCLEEVALLKKLPLPRNTVLIVGTPSHGKLKPRNSAAIICNNKVYYYSKMHLPNYGVFDEQRIFEPGDENKVFSIGKVKFGVSICEDIWIKNGPQVEQANELGASLLINISASPFEAFGKIQARQNAIITAAKKTKAPVVYCNMVGGQDELIFDGRSTIFCGKNERDWTKPGAVAESEPFQEYVNILDVNIKPRRARKRKNTILAVDFTPATATIPNDWSLWPTLSHEDEMYRALKLNLADYVRKNGFEGVVLGMSGGVDSAFVATLATDALGASKVHAISMPSVYNSGETKKDACEQSHLLGIDFQQVPIVSVMTAYEPRVEDALNDSPRVPIAGLTRENLQARIRGTLLMAVSNAKGWLVLNTGNKSEVAVGYFTLYGDSCGGFGPIKDVYKTDLYRLCAFRNMLQRDLFNEDIILPSILQRAPSAELAPDQKDTDSLPPYHVLDEIIRQFMELNMPAPIIKGSLRNRGLIANDDNETVEKVIKLIVRAEYKRRQSAPGTKLTRRAFGRDFRFPITNKYLQ